MKSKTIARILVAIMVIAVLGAALKKPVIEPAITATSAYAEINYSVDAAVCTIIGKPHKDCTWTELFKLARNGCERNAIVAMYTGHR